MFYSRGGRASTLGCLAVFAKRAVLSLSLRDSPEANRSNPSAPRRSSVILNPSVMLERSNPLLPSPLEGERQSEGALAVLSFQRKLESTLSCLQACLRRKTHNVFAGEPKHSQRLTRNLVAEPGGPRARGQRPRAVLSPAPSSNRSYFL